MKIHKDPQRCQACPQVTDRCALSMKCYHVILRKSWPWVRCSESALRESAHTVATESWEIFLQVCWNDIDTHTRTMNICKQRHRNGPWSWQEKSSAQGQKVVGDAWEVDRIVYVGGKQAAEQDKKVRVQAPGQDRKVGSRFQNWQAKKKKKKNGLLIRVFFFLFASMITIQLY